MSMFSSASPLAFTAACVGFAVIGTIVLLGLTSWVVVEGISRSKTEESRLKAEKDFLTATQSELSACFWQIRDIFDHLGDYVVMSDELFEILREVAAQLAQNAPQFLNRSSYLQERCSSASLTQPPGWLRGEGVRRIDECVQRLSDPVMTELWRIRTPSAMAAMLRHGLFLSLGYSQAVAFTESSPQPRKPVFLENRAMPPNAWALPLERLDEVYGRYWRERERAHRTLEPRA